MDEGELSDGLSEWELIQAPAHSTPLITPLAEQHMVATATTKDNSPQHQHHLSVFPPSCRDGLEEEEEVNSSVTSWSMIKGDGANSWSLKNTSAIGNIVVAAMLLSFLYAKVRLWGGRVKKAKKDPLIRLIQEKDQKMKQLLFQIGEMNEILLSAGRRRVPVVRLSC
ncbi:hypothetical protein V6Z11_A03G125300 [Gossypium hirsutum]